MPRKLWYLTIAVAVLLSAAPIWADKGFNGFPGVGAGVGAAEGTVITRLPYTINNPGFYYLTRNLTYSPGFGTTSGIAVLSDDVTIDLMGFSLIGPGNNQGHAISLYDAASSNGHSNVEIRNGTLRNWNEGISTADNCSNNRAINVRTENCILSGINLQGSGSGNLIQGCTAVGSTYQDVGTGITIIGGLATGNTVINCTKGIVGYGTISNNFVSNCSKVGIDCFGGGGGSIIGNTVVATAGTPIGIDISFNNNPVLVTQNAVSGTGTHFVAGSGTVNVANTNAGF